MEEPALTQLMVPFVVVQQDTQEIAAKLLAVRLENIFVLVILTSDLR